MEEEEEEEEEIAGRTGDTLCHSNPNRTASQASQRRRRHHGCTVVAVTTAIIRTRHTRALRQTLYRRGCGHLAPLTNRPPPRPIPSRTPTGFERRYNFKLPTVGGLWPRSDRELRNPCRNFARVRRFLFQNISPSRLENGLEFPPDPPPPPRCEWMMRREVDLA